MAASELVSVPLGQRREAKSQAGRQRTGVGAIWITAQSKVSSWPPANWCGCRWDYSAKQSLKLAASQLASVPLSFHRKRSLKLAVSGLMSLPLSLHPKRSLKLAASRLDSAPLSSTSPPYILLRIPPLHSTSTLHLCILLLHSNTTSKHDHFRNCNITICRDPTTSRHYEGAQEER